MSTKETIHGKSVPRHTDQLLNCSMLFSDYFPNTDRWKITVKGHYASGLPFGPPHTGREKQVFRMSSYRRVDLGMSYRLLKLILLGLNDCKRKYLMTKGCIIEDLNCMTQ